MRLLSQAQNSITAAEQGRLTWRVERVVPRMSYLGTCHPRIVSPAHQHVEECRDACSGVRFPVTASQGSRHSEKDKKGIESPVPESHFAAGDKAGTAGTFVARRQLLTLSSSLSPRPLCRAGQGPSPGRPPSQFTSQVSESVWHELRSLLRRMMAPMAHACVCPAWSCVL